MMEDRLYTNLFYGRGHVLRGCGHVLNGRDRILESGTALGMSLAFPLQNPFELLEDMSTKLFI